ncbi:Nuclear aminoacylation-dependent tRNA export pathway component [Naganishia albida]|nr:Nuclear aminoacylation-dependent tRNA export pathway component [Naganishia albida]
MNILRNIATAALQSTGVTFPFQIGDRLSLGPVNAPAFETSVIWDVRTGVKKDDGQPLTLFVFDLAQQQTGKDGKALFQLARNALKKLRTIRHPNILKYIDSVETDTQIYIATERVTPLGAVLQQWQDGKIVKGDAASRKRGQEEWIAWGLRSIGTALAFLNAPPLSQHHSLLLPTSVFITPALEWRLAGFELLSGKEDPQGVAWAAGLGVGLAPGAVGERIAPEVRKGGWGVLKESDPAVTDGYLFALLIHTVYNPQASLPDLTSAPTQATAGAIPRALFPIFKRMLNPNPRTRLATTSFIPELEKIGFWAGNNLVELVDSLEAFELASEGEKAALLRRIKESIATLPPPFLISRILPSLLHSLSLPSAPSSAILPLVLAIGRDVPEDKYREVVLDPVVRLYTSPDRGTRMALLDGLVEYGDKLDKSMVNDRVWPHLITGFADTVAVIREATVKAIPIIAPKLSDRLLNNDLLRLLAKMQVDPEPSIRTNTCILLGRLAPLLGVKTKKKVLVAAFARSLKDSFVHARVAGLMALMATVEYYDKDDLAGKVVPNMSFTLVDKEKLVRDQAFKAMQMFMTRLEAEAEAMPDTAIPENASHGQTYGPSTTTMLNGSHTAVAGSSLVNSATGAAGALAGWAIASLGKQLPVSEAHSTISATPAQVQQPLYAQQNSSDIFQSTSGVPSRSNTPSQASRPPPIRKMGAMQLGGTTGGARAGVYKPGMSTSLVDELAGEFEEDGDEVANAWGSNDLMDVNADGDDWSTFEEAPVPLSDKNPTQSSQRTKQEAAPEPVPIMPQPPKPKPAASPAQKPVRPKQAVPTAIAAPSTSDGWGAAQDSDWQEGGHQVVAGDKPSPPVNVSLAGMSKEEKEKEMARRREERKARIAAMKKNKT